MRNLEYNYLMEVNNITSIHRALAFNVDEKNRIKRTINGEPYIDADSMSKILYEDLFAFYNGKKLTNGCVIKCTDIKKRKYKGWEFYELIVKVYDTSQHAILQIGLGSDYIGPSIHWAYNAGLSVDEIADFLTVSRTFGGHIIWPRWIGYYEGNRLRFVEGLSSINTARGGSRGLYDRFDLTLYELSMWYQKETSSLNYAFETNKLWLQQFVDFKQFIDFFSLQMFVDEVTEQVYNWEYNSSSNLVPLAHENLYPATIPKTQKEFLNFAKNGSNLIQFRNNILYDQI